MKCMPVTFASPLTATVLSVLLLFCSFSQADEGKKAPAAIDPSVEAFDKYLASTVDGKAAFSFDHSAYQASKEELAALPIGVFDSGIGGLTVLEAILTADAFDNKTLQPGADGRPDFEGERFIYLGDQANMPYGNYSKEGKVDYLRELILKDATFLLGKRQRSDADADPQFDKPPVKAIVIACNTATAYGLADIRAAMQRWDIPVFVVGVVEAGARGLLQGEKTEAQGIGVLATVGTCASEVYPKTIQSTLGRAGHEPAVVTQFGSESLAAIIEGEAGFKNSLEDQIEADVRSLVEAHRDARKGKSPAPLSTIMLGCTHFPLIQADIEAAFTKLRSDPQFQPFLAESRDYIDPAAWTARQLFQELAQHQLRAATAKTPATTWDAFYLSVANPNSSKAVISSDGGLDHDYKYGRETGDFSTEDTVVVPMTRATLSGSGRRLVREQLPETWSRLPAGEAEDLDGRAN